MGRMFAIPLLIVVCMSCIARLCGAVIQSAESAFMQWFLQNGGVVNGIDVAKFPYMGRGFKAVRDLTENEQILQIPHKLIFSTKNMPTYLDERTRKILETLGSDAALYAWLLIEKHKPDSFFKPYLEIMPSYVPSLVYFNPTELLELQSASLAEEVVEMQSSAQTDYKAFLGAYNKITSKRADSSEPAAHISFEEYLWAMSMFNSRGLRFQGPVYMAPMADIFNFQPHPVARPANNGDFFAKHHKLDAAGIAVYADRGHQLRDARQVAAHHQVFEDYGDNSDEIYFKYHGFVPDENPFRCAVLSLDKIGADLVTDLPSSANSDTTASGGAALLPGITATHKALMDALEFSRLPSKCVDRVVDSTSLSSSAGGGSTGGYLGKGLEVLLIMLSFTEKEAAHCMHYIATSSAAAASHGKSKGNAKNWPGIFKECKFSAAEEFVRSVRSQQSPPLTATKDAGQQSLNYRVQTTIQRFIELNLAHDHITTSIADDAPLLAHLQAQLSTGGDNAVLHKYLAVKYRYHRKQLLLNISTRYGATAAVAKLTANQMVAASIAGAAASVDTDSPGWMQDQGQDAAFETKTSEHTVHTTATATAMAAGEGETVVSFELPRAPLPQDAPLSERIRAFNAWFHSLSPQPCHITAQEIPEFRMGTITIKHIDKNEVYLGIPTTHGGIMDSEVALVGANAAVSKLLAEIIATYPKRDDFHELLFFLMHERFVLREESFYWPYLSLLPTYEDMESNAFVPLLWAEEDIKTRLGPSDVSGLITDYHEKTAHRYKAIAKMPLIQSFFPGGENGVFSRRNYQWATVILDSRAIWWNGKRHLVPMLDFVNCQEHAVDKSILHSTTLDAAGKYAITKAAREFKEGEQLFENYGQPNHIYFTYHGFLLQNNSHDCVHLELPLTMADLKALNLQKASPILQKLRLPPNKPSVLPVCLTHPVASMVWAFLAVKTNTFESLHDQNLLGKANLPGADALLTLLDERLANYASFKPSGHHAAQQLLEAEVQHLQLVKAQLLRERATLASIDYFDLDDEL